MILAISTAILVLFLLRVVILIRQNYNRMKGGKKMLIEKKQASLLVVAGSGGHTKELITLLQPLAKEFTPRYYIVSETDRFSTQKIHELERQRQSCGDYEIRAIPRSREVGQSYISAVLSTILATIRSLPILWTVQPDILLCNGPGTCIPVCLWAFLFKVLYIKNIQIIYVESICRVTSLSLSGKILYQLADHFIVQWPEQAQLFDRSLYLGRLM